MALSYIAPLMLVLLWIFQSWIVEHSSWSKNTLSSLMAEERGRWIATMATRDLRMIDTNIISGLQSGTAFFASTSLLAIGGAFTLLTSGDVLHPITDASPLLQSNGLISHETKTIGLMLIYAYAFLKFGWAYRLFNYTSILIGAVPMKSQYFEYDPQSEKYFQDQITKATKMSVNASQEFNRGQRAFFIAIAYLGWYLGDIIFLISILGVYAMLLFRQFFSPAKKALKN